MAECKKRYTTRMELRPKAMPAEWRIFNAPRPIYGEETWEGDFLSGIFYAAVRPGHEREGWMVEENRRLDAAELVFVPYADALKAEQERIIERYGEDARWYVDDERYFDEHVYKHLDRLNYPKPVAEVAHG